jgi:hypothetical protein
MTMRLRGMRRMSMFPNGDPSHLSITEGAIRNELEYGKRTVNTVTYSVLVHHMWLPCVVDTAVGV